MARRSHQRLARGFAVLAITAGSLAWVAAPAPTSAAVRLCAAPVSSGLVKAKTEQEAKKAALDAWRSKAATLGEGYTAWRLAANKLLECLPVKDNTEFECLAKAEPCTIESAPDRRENRERRIGT